MIPADFHFERPLWLLALLPAAWLLWTGARSALRSTAWRSAVDAHLLRHLALPGEGGARRWPWALLGLGWLAATLAMGGPSWERIAQPTTRTIEPTVVALDMSVSMDAEDLTPSRLARARYELQDVLDRSAGGQVGLVIYSDEPFVASPLTDDGRVIREMVPTFTSDLMPGRGSRPDRAIDQAVALLDGAGVPGGRILLLADSAGDRPEATREAAERAAAAGRSVSVLGMGTAEGAPIPDGRGGFARSSSGEVVMARLPSDELQAISAAGNGRYAEVTPGAQDLDVLLANPAPLAVERDDADSSFASAGVEVWKDAGVYLLFVPLLLAPFAFRRGWLAVVVLTLALAAPPSARASVWDDLWKTRDQQGAAALGAGDPARASELFESPDWRAAAQYRSGAFAAAGEMFADLPGTDNRYNLGNALAKSGKLEEAIAAYDEVLEDAPDHEDAKFNRDLVEQLLKQQQQQQEQQQRQSSGDSQDEQESQSEQAGQSGSQGQSQQDESAQSDQSGQESASQQDAASPQPSKEGSESERAQAHREAGEEAGADQEQASGRASSSSEEESSEKQSPSSLADARDDSPQKGQNPPSSQQARADASKPESEADESSTLRDRVDQALERSEPESEPTEEAQVAAAGSHEPMSEEEQAREQMLRRVPDDPAGLLRAKIQRTYAEKRYAEQQRQIVRQGGMVPWW